MPEFLTHAASTALGVFVAYLCALSIVKIGDRIAVQRQRRQWYGKGRRDV